MKLAADANVLLSAIMGGRARAILATLAEVPEYLAQLAQKARLSLDAVLLPAATLPVTVVEPAVYAAKVAEARRRLARRDNDFEDAGVDWYTTASLLKQLDKTR